MFNSCQKGSFIKIQTSEKKFAPWLDNDKNFKIAFKDHIKVPIKFVIGYV